MSGAPKDSEAFQDSQQHAPHPPPFNPMPVHNSQPQTLGNSVVPALMNVYESMTQSSTPQDPNDPSPSGESVYDSHQQILQQQGTYAPFYQHTQASPPGPPPPQHQAYYPPANLHQQQPHQQQHQQQPHQHQHRQQAHYYVPPPVIPPGSFQGPSPPSVPPVPDYPTTTVVEQTPRQQAPTLSPSSSVARVSPPDPAPSSRSSSSGRSLRKRSLDKDSSSEKTTPKTRKKGNNTDGRWSKRFTWPDDLHRDFVSAIFDVGLKHSSPSAILEHMPKHEQITSERIKSHLQKYRIHRNKSKQEFMTSYDASISNFQGGDMDGSKALAQGGTAAHLSCSIMADEDASTSSGSKNEDRKLEPKSKSPPKSKDNSSKLVLPRLSEEEKRSPIGTSLGYLMGLFFSLRQQLMAQRAAEAAAADANSGKGGVAAVVSGDHSQVGAVYSHFATGVQQHCPQDVVPTTWTVPAPHKGAPPQAYHQDPLTEQKNDDKAPPSTRTNFEQNKLMKLEMQNQMAFQNKMRDLKQRELNKYISTPDYSAAHGNKDGKAATEDFTPNPVSHKTEMDEGKDISIDSGINRSQVAGEAAEAGDSTVKGRLRGLSVGVSDDFWNTDVVDEQLFEFLMDP